MRIKQNAIIRNDVFTILEAVKSIYNKNIISKNYNIFHNKITINYAASILNTISALQNFFRYSLKTVSLSCRNSCFLRNLSRLQHAHYISIANINVIFELLEYEIHFTNIIYRLRIARSCDVMTWLQRCPPVNHEAQDVHCQGLRCVP